MVHFLEKKILNKFDLLQLFSTAPVKNIGCHGHQGRKGQLFKMVIEHFLNENKMMKV